MAGDTGSRPDGRMVTGKDSLRSRKVITPRRFQFSPLVQQTCRAECRHCFVLNGTEAAEEFIQVQPGLALYLLGGQERTVFHCGPVAVQERQSVNCPYGPTLLAGSR